MNAASRVRAMLSTDGTQMGSLLASVAGNSEDAHANGKKRENDGKKQLIYATKTEKYTECFLWHVVKTCATQNVI
jgi:hypothetical protein